MDDGTTDGAERREGPPGRGGPARRAVLAVGAGLAALGLGRAVAQGAPPAPAPPPGTPPERLPPFVGPTERQAAPKPMPLPPAERVGFAFVGLGRLTLEELLPAVGATRLCKAAALVTGDPEKGRRVARAHGVPEAAVLGYDAIERLRDNPEVRAVYVVTPNGLHRAHVEAAARAGKAVLCEKPMANTSADAEAMIRACATAKVPLMIAYRLQYEAHHRALIEVVRSGELGALKTIEAHNGQNQGGPQWRHDAALAGGGALPDVGIYCLNMARYVTGEEPSEVMGWTWSTPGDERFKEVEENCAWQMRFPSGVVARLATAYGSHEARRLRLTFERGWVEMDPAFSYQGLKMTVGRRSPDKPSVEVREVRDLRARNQFAAEMDHFAECVLTGRRPRTPGEEGLADHRVMEAIYASAREGGRVMRFAPGPGGLDATRGPPLATEG